MTGPQLPRCAATLEHTHGISRCERNAFHSEDSPDFFWLGVPLEEHLGSCGPCEDDDGYGSAPLSWRDFREVWA